ncbi:MAG TPA: carbamoyltransferase HypF, partial [Terriglobales bacterium]|nr:carbamoyltransferase HypF [Terriglobales bacterium]
YGTDGRIWGGEVLLADFAGFERSAHFEYVPMPGGAAAIHEPWRMAVSYLAHHFGDEFLRMRLPFLAAIERSRLDVLLRIQERRVNSPLTSSCGRLFDAVAAIAGIRNRVTYEAQAAIEFEMAAADFDASDAYSFDLAEEMNADHLILTTRSMFEELLDDVHHGVPNSVISRRFHNGLANIFVRTAGILRERTSLNRVCLSGGTFNNLCLTTRMVSELSSRDFEVFTQNEVPAGDGGLSLGQAMVAAHTAKTRM